MERDIRIDILKGIGIILVVWGHATAILIKEILYFPYAFVFLFGRYVLSSQTRIYSIKSKTVAYSLWGIFSDIRCILF